MAIVSSEDVRGNGVKRILYGQIHTLDTGVKLYLARRKHREIFRSGRSSISGAMTDAVAAWAIDEKLLFGLRVKGITFVGVDVIDTGDRYVTRLSTWFDRKTSALRDYTGIGRGGSRQRYVHLQHFQKLSGIARMPATLY